MEMFKFFSFFLFTFVSSYIIYSFSSYDSFSYSFNSLDYVSDGNKVENVVTNKESPIMHISIPKIKVENDVYSKDSISNNIDKNVQIMGESDMPDDEWGNVILGGHSGTGRFAYFKDFSLLDIGDKIVILYNGKKYSYSIINIYSDDKDGKIVIRRDISKNYLTLFTCNPQDKGSYLVVVSELL